MNLKLLRIFFKFKNYDVEEMYKAEGNVTQAQRFELRMASKKEQVQQIKKELSNFKNEKFKTKVAEFLYWINFVLDSHHIFSQNFPTELKTYLTNVKRYDNDVITMAEDVNRKFKHLSVSRGTPAP